eukprot:Gregarina_sp_Pseudo_9__458@NODE_1297_length_1705_cov_65_359544_g1218_i0_p1_GENE_NODE_1297_length_1705_cov_65_359544_g1218_i0NODE_1297_length_1705_cov_65_359544_g1218_i0_p1_ORF_typecomplete_len421_score110_62DMT_YdcZ/PF04657_13/1_5e10DMT_YdcZ/PF04657_13/7_7e187TMRDISM_7TM/PF07695_11/0_000837TMRDISM_7TM/PF07695_11/3_4e02DUF3341/PF11821_8/0_81DUF3341/PF11821_8/3_2e02_NODE_1297_length_1705_cov_65_359544_g1218_i04031665
MASVNQELSVAQSLTKAVTDLDVEAGYSASGPETVAAAPVAEGSKRTQLLHKLLWAVVPFTVGCANPCISGLMHEGQELTDNVYFVLATCSSLGALFIGVYNFFTSKYSMQHNWMAVGQYCFGKRVRWIILSGGLLGVAQYVLMTWISSAGGSSVSSLGQLLGSVCTSMILDSTGLFWVRKSRTSTLAILCALVVAGGAIVHSLGEILTNTSVSLGWQIGFIFLALIAGVCTCLQACVGGRLAFVTGEFRRATCWSLITGGASSWIIAPYVSAPHLKELYTPNNWWRLAHTFLLAYTIAGMSLSQKKMATAIVYCWFVVGQLITSTLVDAFGWFGFETRAIDKYKLSGLFVVLLGVAGMTAAKVQSGRKERRVRDFQNEMKFDGGVEGDQTDRKLISAVDTPTNSEYTPNELLLHSQLTK